MLTKSEVKAIIDSYYEASRKLLAEGATDINGVPLFVGKDIDESKIIHRFPFFSLYSKPMHEFIASGKLKPLLNVLEGYKPRIAEDEKDGVVFNHYVNAPNSKFKQMGWHTDNVEHSIPNASHHQSLASSEVLRWQSSPHVEYRCIPR